MILSMIYAADERGLIGRAGGLPWRLATDLARFARITAGKPLIVGRRTWESLPKPLHNRPLIVLTRNTEWLENLNVSSDVWFVKNADGAYGLARGCGYNEAFVIGGASVYRAFENSVTRVYATTVFGPPAAGDTFYVWPRTAGVWVPACAEFYPADDLNERATIFVRWERLRAGE